MTTLTIFIKVNFHSILSVFKDNNELKKTSKKIIYKMKQVIKFLFGGDLFCQYLIVVGNAVSLSF